MPVLEYNLVVLCARLYTTLYTRGMLLEKAKLHVHITDDLKAGGRQSQAEALGQVHLVGLCTGLLSITSRLPKCVSLAVPNLNLGSLY